MSCCDEYGCKRKNPFLVRLTPFGRRWVVVTRYTVKGDLVDAQEKHDIHDELVAALVAEGWTPPRDAMTDEAVVDAWDADEGSLYNADENEAVHLMFGLTYSSYLVLPRVLLQSMPSDWQLQFCRLLEWMEQAFEHVEKPFSYRVYPIDDSGKFTRETLPPYNRGRTRVGLHDSGRRVKDTPR